MGANTAVSQPALACGCKRAARLGVAAVALEAEPAAAAAESASVPSAACQAATLAWNLKFLRALALGVLLESFCALLRLLSLCLRRFLFATVCRNLLGINAQQITPQAARRPAVNTAQALSQNGMRA